MRKFIQKASSFIKGEEGSLSDMTWVIGSAVVVVLVIVVFMSLAPSTAQSIWSSFVNYARTTMGF